MAQMLDSMRDLNRLMGGAINERWQDALDKLARNVLDPNTDAKRPRSITMTLKVKPNERRDGGEMTFDIKENLAPPVAISQTVLFDRSDDGTVTATQMLDQIPGQVDMQGGVTPEPVSAELGNAGEPIEQGTARGNVINFI